MILKGDIAMAILASLAILLMELMDAFMYYDVADSRFSGWQVPMVLALNMAFVLAQLLLFVYKKHDAAIALSVVSIALFILKGGAFGLPAYRRYGYMPRYKLLRGGRLRMG